MYNPFRRNGFLLGALVVSALFWATAPFLPRILVFDFLNAVVISLGAGILVAYAPGVWETMTTPTRSITTGHILVLGIWLTWLASLLRSCINWIWRYLDKPPDLLDALGVAFLLLVLIMGGTLHLTAQDAVEGRVPPEGWRRLGVLITLGLGLGFLVFTAVEYTPGNAPIGTPGGVSGRGPGGAAPGR